MKKNANSGRVMLNRNKTVAVHKHKKKVRFASTNDNNDLKKLNGSGIFNATSAIAVGKPRNRQSYILNIFLLIIFTCKFDMPATT